MDNSMMTYPKYRVGEVVYYYDHECVIREVVDEPRTIHNYGSYIISSTTDDNYFKNAGPYEIDGVMCNGNKCGSMYLEKKTYFKPVTYISKHKMK